MAFNTMLVLQAASVSTIIYLHLPMGGSTAAPAQAPLWGKGNEQSPGLLQATYLPRDEFNT